MKSRLLSILILSFLTISCTKSQEVVVKRPAKDSAPIPGSLTDHVFLIGFDGMASAYFNAEELPTIKSLMEAGCWTMNKRSVRPTSSTPNWTAMFMGAGPDSTGYLDNSNPPKGTPKEVNENGIFPTINSILREQYPDSETGAVFEWKNIRYLLDNKALDYNEWVPDHLMRKKEIANLAVSYIKDYRPRLFTIVYDSPDHEGHQIGWDSDAYHNKMQFLDGELARILQAIKDAGIWEESTIIVTSDHGGIGKSHGGDTQQESNTPFIIAGKGIRKGGEFQDNMMQYDVAPTIAALFKLERPQVWEGSPMVQCFENQ